MIEKTLDIIIKIEYDGPSEHYKYCTHKQYSPELNAFLNLGDCSTK